MTLEDLALMLFDGSIVSDRKLHGIWEDGSSSDFASIESSAEQDFHPVGFGSLAGKKNSPRQ